MDYIAGQRDRVDVDLLAAGYERIGVDMYRKDGRRIRWVSGAERIRGVEGADRRFILREPFDPDVEREARVRRFHVVTTID